MNVYFKSVTGCNPNINLMLIFKEIAVSAKLLSKKSAEKYQNQQKNQQKIMLMDCPKGRSRYWNIWKKKYCIVQRRLQMQLG